MTLEEALDQIAQLPNNEAVFAKRPWGWNSEAMMAQLDQEYRVPQRILDLGFEYVLDGFIAKDVLRDAFGSREPSPLERRKLLLYYAEHDAWPDWLSPKE
jgi:hypothetical protein